MLAAFVLAVGLAMDATAVSAARGLAAGPRLRLADALKVGAFFGGAQALMPVGGLLLDAGIGRFIARFDHWVAFVILAGLGGKMLVEAIRGGDDDDDKVPADLFGWRTLAVLALATSIDAFAAGVTLPMLALPPTLSIAVIGVVTFVFSVAGLYAGRRFGHHLGRRLDIIGGVVLIGLGIEMLVRGLMAAT